MIRIFKHKSGFMSGVEHMLWNTKTGKGSRLMTDLTVEGVEFSEEQMNMYVSEGYWIEIKQDGEKCSGCRCETVMKPLGLAAAWKRFHERHDLKIKIDMSDKIKQPPIDFSTAQVGDTVHSILHGPVKVLSSDGSGRPIKVKPFAAGEDRWILRDGRLHSSDLTPLIAGWVDTGGNLCRTRPEPKIDWSKVAIDAPVEVNGTVKHFAKVSDTGTPMFWLDGKTSHTCGAGRGKSGSTQCTYKLINTEEK